MTQKRTFAFLKPACDRTQSAIIAELQFAGFTVLREETRVLDIATLKEHYAHHVDKPFFQPMASYLTNGASILLILSREDEADPVQSLRDLVGPTDPKKGEKEQIRCKYGAHLPDVIFMNAIHASGTPAEVEEEIARFFPDQILSPSWKISQWQRKYTWNDKLLAKRSLFFWFSGLFFPGFSL